MKVDFVGPTYQARSLNFDAQRCVNFYPEVDQTGKEVIALVGTPGLKTFAFLGTDATRGQHTFNDRIYVVYGDKLCSINAGGVVSATLGTLSTSTGRVDMDDNGLSPTGGNHLIITDGAFGYILDVSTNTFTTLTSGGHGFPATGADTVTFMDGYFICNVGGGSGSFVVSALYNGLSWNPLDISTADSDPDKLVAVDSNHRELWLFGETTAEGWYDAGSGHPPFARIPGAIIEHGIAARWSLAKVDGINVWLAQGKHGQGYVVSREGYGAKRISTPALEYQWAQYSTISDAFAFAYSMEGHVFYVITFPTGDATFAYDFTTGLWHERSSYKNNPYTTSRWIANGYIFFQGRHFVGDYKDGDIYEMSSTTYVETVNPIVSMRRTRHLSDEMKNLFISQLQVDMETGVGTLSGQGQNPSMMLRWSDDGGHTWSNEYAASIGAIGSFKTRAIWRRLGKTRDRVFEVSISDPVKRIIIGAQMEASKGWA